MTGVSIKSSNKNYAFCRPGADYKLIEGISHSCWFSFKLTEGIRAYSLYQRSISNTLNPTRIILP